jgi:hypothetical protein
MSPDLLASCLRVDNCARRMGNPLSILDQTRCMPARIVCCSFLHTLCYSWSDDDWIFVLANRCSVHIAKHIILSHTSPHPRVMAQFSVRPIDYQLIHPFPLEITRMILYELPLLDLIRCYFLSPVWKTALDGDNTLRALMFRPSKEWKNEKEAAHVAWVKRQWKGMYARVNENKRSQLASRYWAEIPVSSLLSSSYYQRRRFYQSKGSMDTDGPLVYRGKVDAELSDLKLSRKDGE